MGSYLLLYHSAINIDTALVCEFEGTAIVHELENDKLHLLSESIVQLLKAILNDSKTEAQLLQLICEYGSSVFDESAEDKCKAYLQHLVSQGIIKKTQ